MNTSHNRLVETRPDLHRLLTIGGKPDPIYAEAEIRCSTVAVAMRDGICLASDLYLPPASKSPVIVMRTPYGRASQMMTGVFRDFARRGFAVVSQDCRGTGNSEPDCWHYYMFEADDGLDCVAWILGQDWCDGFVASCGGSYAGQTQWAMGFHPLMSAIAPEVSGLGIASNTVHLHMNIGAYACSVGKGREKSGQPYRELERQIVDETLSEGVFNEPLLPEFSDALRTLYPELDRLDPFEAQNKLWQTYCSLSGAKRAELIMSAFGVPAVTILEVEHATRIFGQHVAHDAHTVPTTDFEELARRLAAPALIKTGWYDWALNDALETFRLIKAHACPEVADRTKLIVAPSAHNLPGYGEGMAEHPELRHNHRTPSHIGLLLAWYGQMRRREADRWFNVIYYLMGANEWRYAEAWPPADVQTLQLYLQEKGGLSSEPPAAIPSSSSYIYDPLDPTPSPGGKVVSSVYPAGSVDVAAVRRRTDLLVFSTPPLERDIDVVGPLRIVLHASSNAVDTDFSVRLCDLLPDGRALFIQSGILRARFRGERPQLLRPDAVHELTIDLWATANRFKAGHRISIDISSADFPQYDRNANLGGAEGQPKKARQTLFHDARHPSRLILSVLGEAGAVEPVGADFRST